MQRQIANAIIYQDQIETDSKIISHVSIEELKNIQGELIEASKYNRSWNRLLILDYYQIKNCLSLTIPIFEEEDKGLLQQKRYLNKRNRNYKYIRGNKLGDIYKAYKKAINRYYNSVDEINAKHGKLKESEKRIDILNIQKNQFILEMRLTPIKKVSSLIPNQKQIRSICVQTHVIKLIELFYTGNLQRLMKYEIGQDQVGFVLGLVVEYARNKAPNKQIVFIHLTNAYNPVNRACIQQSVFLLLLQQNKQYMRYSI